MMIRMRAFRSRPGPRPQPLEAGFTLIEVMVAIVILSFGLLGVAGLMVLGIQNTYSSQQRSAATQLAYDMIDRMRSNRVGVDLTTSGVGGNYDRPIGNVTSGGGPYVVPQSACVNNTGITTGTCSPANMADEDAFEWQQAIRERLGGGVAIICRDSSTADGSYDGTTITHACVSSGPMYAIKIYWKDDRTTESTNTKYQSLVTRFVP